MADHNNNTRRPLRLASTPRGNRSCRWCSFLLVLLAALAVLGVGQQGIGLRKSLSRLGNVPVALRGESEGGGGGGRGDGHGAISKPQVAVCFFGLTRSLRWTVPSVKQRLLGVLRDEGMRVDIFVHTYHLREVNNERAGEKNIKYAPYATDYHALHPTRSLVTDQDDFDLAWPEPLSMTRYRWHYAPETREGVIRNVFRAYWSLSQVWGLMAEHSLQQQVAYDAVVMARPDVWYHVDTDLPRRTFPLPERTVFLPSFDTDDSPGGRKNDRFGYGSVTAMRVLMNRMATLLDPDADRFYSYQLDSEWVLGHHLQLRNTSVHMVDFPVTRVRLNGGIPFYDQGRVRAACSEGVDPMACEMVRLDYNFPKRGHGA